MKNLTEQIDSVITRYRLPWTRRGQTITVELWYRGRKQNVHFDRRGEMYVFSSVVLDAHLVTRNKKNHRDLARRAWRKNALIDLVTFAFDDKHRLIGVLEQPVATLDTEELRFYVETLAKDCDRFEYVLTGRDVQ